MKADVVTDPVFQKLKLLDPYFYEAEWWPILYSICFFMLERYSSYLHKYSEENFDDDNRAIYCC